MVASLAGGGGALASGGDPLGGGSELLVVVIVNLGVMLNYFFTIKSHIIDLFMMGRFMQYRFEIDVVPLVVGVVPLGVGDGGGFDVVGWWPIGTCGGLMGVGVACC